MEKMKAKGQPDIVKQFDRLTKMKSDSKMECVLAILPFCVTSSLPPFVHSVSLK